MPIVFSCLRTMRSTSNKSQYGYHGVYKVIRNQNTMMALFLFTFHSIFTKMFSKKMTQISRRFALRNLGQIELAKN